jgi:hypothetical protein
MEIFKEGCFYFSITCFTLMLVALMVSLNNFILLVDAQANNKILKAVCTPNSLERINQ